MASKENYQKELEAIMQKHAAAGEVPKVLLHSCCGPCSSYCLLYLTQAFDLVDYYYNPNIDTEEEASKRARELERLIGIYREEGLALHEMTFVEGRYDPREFYQAVKGLEKEPEGGDRCAVCFRLRLTEAAKKAREVGADYFATTLTISPMKNADVLNAIGREIGEAYGIPYLATDFKKRGGYLASCNLSRKYDMYRQDYCGCIFSKLEREARKNLQTDLAEQE